MNQIDVIPKQVGFIFPEIQTKGNCMKIEKLLNINLSEEKNWLKN